MEGVDSWREAVVGRWMEEVTCSSRLGESGGSRGTSTSNSGFLQGGPWTGCQESGGKLV